MEMEDAGKIILQIPLHRVLVQADNASSPRTEKQDELKPVNLKTLKTNWSFLKHC